jgi:hypothetical protein
MSVVERPAPSREATSPIARAALIARFARNPGMKAVRGYLITAANAVSAIPRPTAAM